MSNAPTAAPVRVVVADDDERLRDMLVGLLDDLGFDVIGSVPDGPSVLESCRRAVPDVVLLDNRMPGLSGSDTAARLREEHPQLPVVMLSAYDDPGLQAAARQAGAVAYLVKGCSASEIADTLDAAAGAARGA